MHSYLIKILNPVKRKATCFRKITPCIRSSGKSDLCKNILCQIYTAISSQNLWPENPVLFKYLSTPCSICSDKTGTLTTNRMTVVQSFIAGKFFKDCVPDPESIPLKTCQLLVTGISVNSNYTSKIIPPAQEGGEPQQLGNKTECSLLGFVTGMKRSYEEVRKAIPESSFIKVYTFNSARKSMSTVIKLEDGGYRIFTKGASEIILRKCINIMDGNGEAVAFTGSTRADLQKKVIDPMACDSLRNIGLAYKDFAEGELDIEDENAVVNGLTLVGIVGIEDPVRPEVPPAIEKCKKAGICVRMVTGDNVKTATSIATKCGIYDPNDKTALIMEGKWE